MLKSQIIAHRGASKYAPENTMPSFQIASEMQADGIETDVQLTKDGIPILIHDENLRRTTGKKGFVKDYLLDDIQKLDAGRYFSKKYAGTKIITLEEFLRWASKEKLYLNLELKNNKIEYKDIEHIVLEALEKHQLLERTTVSSFNPNSIKRMRQLDEKLDVALLRSKRHPNLVEYALDQGASSLHINRRLLNNSIVDNCKKHGLPLRVYTVNRRSTIYQCLKLKCDGIITDDPDKAFMLRKRYNR